MGSALRGAAIYLLFGALWIALSDTLLAMWVSDPADLSRYQTYKGWAYVVLTAALAWLLLARAASARAGLEASEQRFRRAVEDAPFPVIIHAEDGEILSVSRTWTDITGYSRAEIPTIAAWTERAYGERHAKVRERIEALYGLQARADEGEFEIRCRDGSLRVWDFSSAPLGRTADGRRAVISMAMDVTQRKEAEAAMREQLALRDQLAKIAATVPGVIHSFELRPDGSARFPYASPAIEQLYGVKPEVLAGDAAPVFAITHDDDRERLRHSVEESARSMEPWHEEFRVLHPTRGERWIEGRSVPAREPGGGIIWHGFLMDATERKQAEAELRRLNEELEARVRERTAQIEAANRELETFAYSVSHDLKAPLRGIDGYGRLLEEDCGEALQGDCRLFLYNIRHGTQQMSNLIDDLLAYSRMERRELRMSRIDLEPMLRAVLAEQAEAVRARGATVELALGGESVLADRDGLAVVLRNLLGNALKFGDASRPPVIRIGTEERETGLVLWVRDNGIGFDMKFHERIFDIFQRLQRAEDYPGTGIGLALVRKAVQRMGGRVWAESSPGDGATFFVELPR